MNTLIILITHSPTASAFQEALNAMRFPYDKDSLLCFDIPNGANPKNTAELIHQHAQQYPSIVILTDLIGSTPFHIAEQVCVLQKNRAVPEQKLENSFLTINAAQKVNFCLQSRGTTRSLPLKNPPNDLCSETAEKNKSVRIVTGINLPMLLKAINYQYLPADELSTKILLGTRESVLIH